MPAIQTYEAKAIRVGFYAHKGDHQGTVLAILQDPPPGAVSFSVDCTFCGRQESWLGIPKHSAMHARPEAK